MAIEVDVDVGQGPGGKEPSFKNLTSGSFRSFGGRQHQQLQDFVKPHVDSFNYMLRDGLSQSVKDISPMEFALPSGQRIQLYYTDAHIQSPEIAPGNTTAAQLKVFPAECRERRTTYKGSLHVQLGWTVDGVSFGPVDKLVGQVPIMVKSAACNLHQLTPKQLIQHGEEAEEMGGYFVINGIEKVIRMLIMPRRNFPLALVRPSWKNRGPQYTEYGIQTRCVKADQTASTVVLHYLNNGTATLSFVYKKEQFFVPLVLVLKALLDATDQFIYSELIKKKSKDSFYKGCITNMLRQASDEGLSKQSQILKFIGEKFRIKAQLPEWCTDSHIAEYLIRKSICIHLDSNKEKFDLLVKLLSHDRYHMACIGQMSTVPLALCYMTRKLFALAKAECAVENADNPMFQEVLLGGQLLQMVIKEKLENSLNSLRVNIENQAKKKGLDYILDLAAINLTFSRVPAITHAVEYLMSTGNLVSKTGLGLMQYSGLTVVADKLNFYRYLSHFRCVHRGAFFATMRTTAVRKLLPESWGFICPVHTPDGSPCGLMNHLAADCEVTHATISTQYLPLLLCQLGMTAYDSPSVSHLEQCYPVMLDGRMLGWMHEGIAESITEQLRQLKVTGQENVSQTMEICLVPRTPVASQYPGLYLFTGLARLIRPVLNLSLQSLEYIGTFEQVYLNICVTTAEAHEGITTHQELKETSMLSAIASLTPFSDFNQSPRNMYQCQMGKQTMGTPLHAFGHRSDNKLYRLQTPQTPIVRPYAHDLYNIDNYPLGTNAVVAVISYTGFDMEDAMVVNKGSFERGFGHGSVYKTEFIDLKEADRGRLTLKFGCKPDDKRTKGRLDRDGLPVIGSYLKQGDPFYSYIDVQTGEMRVQFYKSQEAAYVDQIKLLGNDLGNEELQKVCILLRIERNPIIGDKFSSRHGQKGICSQKWPVQNMPFSESGMVPDILFNPHGFPSRMTIGMMVESMAGKSGAMHGLCHDATPFTFSEDDSAIDHFGQLLTAAGYNFCGTERLYSGIDGRELEADIFMGVIYYQRLRHMVSDKYQVRTTGPIDPVTHQPVKGRKRAGGIRFGEMERDALLAHGTSFLLKDRLLNCSDKATAYVCSSCGSILSPCLDKPVSNMAAASTEATQSWFCSSCEKEKQGKDSIHPVTVPYVFKYLVAELASMNVKLTLDIQRT